MNSRVLLKRVYKITVLTHTRPKITVGWCDIVPLPGFHREGKFPSPTRTHTPEVWERNGD